MPTVHTDLPAVVLDSRDHGESDKIITMFCKDIGKLTAIAKGAHRSKKRFVNKLELFSFLHITYSKSAPSGLALLEDGDLLNSFVSLRSSIQRYTTATLFQEFVLLATNELLPDDELFHLILWAFHCLDSGDDCRLTAAVFLVKFFDAIGYRPDFSCCQSCGLMYQGRSPALFSNRAGGLVCSKCSATGEHTGRTLSPGGIRIINAIHRHSLNSVKRIKISGEFINDLLELSHRYGRHLFQREINSWKHFSALK